MFKIKGFTSRFLLCFQMLKRVLAQLNSKINGPFFCFSGLYSGIETVPVFYCNGWQKWT